MTEAQQQTVDQQKNLLYAEVTRRAGLYGKLFALQRNGATPEAIDGALVALGECESEIRRLSDEVNDRIWYKNAGALLESTQAQVESLKRIEASVQAIEMAVNAQGVQLKAHGKRIAAIERTLKKRPGERAKEHAELVEGQTRIAAQVADLDTRHATQWGAVIERLDTDEQRLDRKRAELDNHETRLQEIEKRLGIQGIGDGA